MTLTEEQKEKNKLYREQNKEKIKEYQKQYRQEHRDKIKEQNKAYWEKNKEKLTEKNKTYWEENKEKLTEKNKEYRYSFEGRIKEKLHTCLREDRYNSRDNNLDFEYIVNLLEQQNNKCKLCNINVKLDWIEKMDKEQFSINRIDNNIGHLKTNVEITCWDCNNKQSNFYKKGYNNQNFKRGSLRKDPVKNCIRYVWYNENKRRQEKSFSINKYGEEQAFKLARDIQNEVFPINKNCDDTFNDTHDDELTESDDDF